MIWLTAFGGCSSEAPPRNIVLITLDTLAASHLGCYGYPRQTSPNIDRFAKTATLYERAFASSPWSLPTHASLMTGLYPSEHGARAYKVDPDHVDEYGLQATHFTLSEALQKEGFQTAAFTSNTAYLSARFGFSQGFDLYFNQRLHGELLNEEIFGWLEAHGDRPFFLFINYMDTHSPYNTRKPSQRPDFLGDVSTRKSEGMIRGLSARVMRGEASVSRTEIQLFVGLQLLVDLYDISIANVDEYVEALFEKLRQMNLYQDTLIVVTSDHGEYFGEHGLLEHGKDVYQGALWIPLIVKKAGQVRGRTVDVEVSSVDVPHLVFAQLHEPKADSLRRFSRAPGRHLVISENYYAYSGEFNYSAWRGRFDRIRRAAYDWPHKYIESSDGDHELYDLQEDPGELDNLVTARPQVAARIKRSLERLPASDEPIPGPVPTPSAHDLEELKALGYL